MYRVDVAGLRQPLVLRVYSRRTASPDMAAPEMGSQDTVSRAAAVCRKEVDLHRLVAARVPVPEILYADFTGDAAIGPHVVMSWIEGLTFREIKRRRDPDAVAACASAIGAVLARIGEFTFERPGIIGPALAIGAPLLDGEHPIPAFVEKCLTSPEFGRRMELQDRACLREFIWRCAPELAALHGESALVHSDFGSPNLLVRPIGGRWTVTGVLDWEFAFSGPSLCDVGHMMRYERRATPKIEPHFSNSFREHGGALPVNWRKLSRVLDLTALCEFLTRPALPASIVPEILELILATVEDRDPR